MSELSAVYVAANEEALIAESIRSVKAYVDRIVVVDAVFEHSPVAGAHSSDAQRQVVERMAAPLPLVYLESDRRLPEHEARNLALAQVPEGEWALIIDADEVLYGEHARLIGGLRGGLTLALHVFTTAVLDPRSAPAIDPETYATAPLINTGGWQVKVVQRRVGLEVRRVEHEPGRFTHNGLWWNGVPVSGLEVEQPFVINHRARRSHAAYQAAYAWEVAQGASP